MGALRQHPSHPVFTRRDRQVELTAREFDLFEVLARSPGRPHSREELLAAVWADDSDVTTNVVDVYVGYLRRKLERPRGPRLIRTIRGRGFMLDLT